MLYIRDKFYLPSEELETISKINIQKLLNNTPTQVVATGSRDAFVNIFFPYLCKNFHIFVVLSFFFLDVCRYWEWTYIILIWTYFLLSVLISCVFNSCFRVYIRDWNYTLSSQYDYDHCFPLSNRIGGALFVGEKQLVKRVCSTPPFLLHLLFPHAPHPLPSRCMLPRRVYLQLNCRWTFCVSIQKTAYAFVPLERYACSSVARNSLVKTTGPEEGTKQPKLP